VPFRNRLRIQEYGPDTWQLMEPVVYEGKYDNFTVPGGYVTDFASVPRFLHWLVSPYGAYTNAAIVHDWLITDLIPAKSITSRDTDGIFRRIMEELGVPFATRWLMWGAVRLGALFNPRRSYGRDFYRDAPRVLLILILAAPFVLPGAIGSLISLGLVKVFEALIKGVSR
jgi:hypothetical protein